MCTENYSKEKLYNLSKVRRKKKGTRGNSAASNSTKEPGLEDPSFTAVLMLRYFTGDRDSSLAVGVK